MLPSLPRRFGTVRNFVNATVAKQFERTWIGSVAESDSAREFAAGGNLIADSGYRHDCIRPAYPFDLRANAATHRSRTITIRPFYDRSRHVNSGVTGFHIAFTFKRPQAAAVSLSTSLLIQRAPLRRSMHMRSSPRTL